MAEGNHKIQEVKNPHKLLEELTRNLPANPGHNPVLESFTDLDGRIGLMGGSFDPPHFGHLIAARTVCRQLNLHCCVFVPAHQNPLKQSTPLASDRQRFDMLKAVLIDQPDFYVSPIELDLNSNDLQQSKGLSYTVDTLEAIKPQLKENAQLFLMIGSDALTELQAWHKLDRIAELATLVLMVRHGFPVEELNKTAAELPQKIKQLLQDNLTIVPQVAFSSSLARQMLGMGKIPQKYLPEKVLDYAANNELYGYSKKH